MKMFCFVLKMTSLMAASHLKLHDMTHKTFLNSLQKHCQMVFSRFMATTIVIPAENTRHSEFPGHIPVARYFIGIVFPEISG
jgi:hypothetical protein